LYFQEICEDPHLFVSGIDTKDVTQGKLGNCWFVAACALVAQEALFWRKVNVQFSECIFDNLALLPNDSF
jgi:calpain-5